jgi:SAM-dependent methyltransferase
MLEKLLQKFMAWNYKRTISRFDFEGKTVAQIFAETYHNRYWRSKESVSGRGSELGQTATLRAELPLLLQGLGVKTLLDLPCGDFNWMQYVELGNIEYIGADIVPELVERNNARYARTGRSFQHLDLLSDPLPRVDAILVRDCLVHLSFEHIEQALANIKKSGTKYLLTTTFPNVDSNEDIQTGHWRALNMELPPFALPQPFRLLNERCTEGKGAYADKSLAVFLVG